MVSLSTPICEFDTVAIDFELPDTEGTLWNLEKIRGTNGLLVMFICNHCPYVKSILDRIVRDTRELKEQHGINAVAIMSNDATQYAEDSPENMAKIAADMNFPFPYLIDADQAIAKAYGAVCTPDFFAYNAKMGLQYRGRLDASRKAAAAEGVRRDLFEALSEMAATSQGPRQQTPSMGCSIKWIGE